MDLVCFDFDGVLANSMERHAIAYQEILADYGVHHLVQDVYDREGSRSETIIRELAAMAEVELTDEQVAAVALAKQERYRAEGFPPLYPEAEAMLRAVPGKVAVVTGTKHRNVEAMLAHVIELVSVIRAQEDYNHDKPHPEPYAGAMVAAGVAPERTLVVENAVKGIMSGRAAGAGLVWGIATTMPAEELLEAGADKVFATHGELVAALAGLDL